MSLVSNVMLSVGYDDEANAEAFSTWLHEKRWGSLNLITGAGNGWGGYKAPECTVYAGTVNYGDHEAMVDRFESTEWKDAESAQLFITDQEGTYFRLWMIRDGVCRQYAPKSQDDKEYEAFLLEQGDIEAYHEARARNANPDA